ncbi:MAG: 2-oxoacid:acceptor oxidoreductase subunit alpha [Phycisphaerales bacterium]|nr:2-oxoacid:acceptor oxidoreductase subunit alpha [Phycisphaerales bacterium]
MNTSATAANRQYATETLESAVIRFCGDSGDGMQLTGGEFTTTSAMYGNDVATFPDFPAEIRAPAGTLPGVSGFQVNFASTEIYTPGDKVDVLIAMNPAGLKTNIADLKGGGILIVNEDAFNNNNLKKAGYASNPLEDESLKEFRLFKIPISRLCEESLAETGMGAKAIGRAKNMYTLGIVYWLFDRSLEPTIKHLTNLFAKKKNQPELAELNIKALKAGYYMGETAEMFQSRYVVPKAKLAPGKYRQISGNEATALGLIAGARLANKTLTYAGYPITPASDILHFLSAYKNYHVKTLQMEDEIAAICAAIGASFTGDIAITASSGPGIALKGEGIGLAVMTELPVVIVNVQRGGPSTGLPTKTEQADLLQAVYGRNSECPCIVIAARSPGDCFDAAVEAVRLAVKYMTPVMLLTDGYIANGAEPWLLPQVGAMKPIEIKHATEFNGHSDDADGEGNNVYLPYLRNENLARPWAIPGTPKLEHRVGGLEKAENTGNVSYDPRNHQRMVDLRQAKVEKVAQDIPPTEIQGESSGDALIIGWGGTYGALHAATERLLKHKQKVGTVHLRHINPLPPDLGDIISRFKHIIVPELNKGQLIRIIRDHFLVDAVGINKVQGKPFLVSELVAEIEGIIAR